VASGIGGNGGRAGVVLSLPAGDILSPRKGVLMAKGKVPTDELIPDDEFDEEADEAPADDADWDEIEDEEADIEIDEDLEEPDVFVEDDEDLIGDDIAVEDVEDVVDVVEGDEEDDDEEEDDDDDEDDEALDELEAEELEMLTDDEASETLVVDEAQELRAIRRAEIAMEGEGGGERAADEFLCHGCFLVLKRSQLADKKRNLCRDCAG